MTIGNLILSKTITHVVNCDVIEFWLLDEKIQSLQWCKKQTFVLIKFNQPISVIFTNGLLIEKYEHVFKTL